MPIALALATGLAGVATIALMARRDGRVRRSQRKCLFDACRSVFETSRTGIGADGFPYLDGTLAGRLVRLRALPDTLTFKRLPQLWLSLTLRSALPIDGDIAVLARPTGAEFFAITQRLRLRLALPTLLSGELLARGSGTGAQEILDRLADPLDRLFADPRIKEVAVTRNGLRAVYQVDQGNRGDYLLLRQSVFARGRVDPGVVLAILDRLSAIETSLLEGSAASTIDDRIQVLV